jgi:hypothetical protein
MPERDKSNPDDFLEFQAQKIVATVKSSFVVI